MPLPLSFFPTSTSILFPSYFLKPGGRIPAPDLLSRMAVLRALAMLEGVALLPAGSSCNRAGEHSTPESSATLEEVLKSPASHHADSLLLSRTARPTDPVLINGKETMLLKSLRVTSYSPTTLLQGNGPCLF